MIRFKQSDLNELRDSCNYLSDVIIEFYFTYLSSIHPSDSILFVPPTISFLVANSIDDGDILECLKPLELSSKNLIFFPVNNGGIHWSLLIYYRGFNLFAHHDSLNGLNNTDAEELYMAVKDFVHDTNYFRHRIMFTNKIRHRDSDPGYICAKTPRQKNGFDCGLYVMAMAKAICGWFCTEVREQNWMRDINENVDDSVGVTMRPLLLELIREASVGRLGSVSCTIEEERHVSVPSSVGILGPVSCSCTTEEEGRVNVGRLGPVEEEGRVSVPSSVGRLGSVSCTTEEEECVSVPRWDDSDISGDCSGDCSEDDYDDNDDTAGTIGGLTKEETDKAHDDFWANLEGPPRLIRKKEAASDSGTTICSPPVSDGDDCGTISKGVVELIEERGEDDCKTLCRRPVTSIVANDSPRLMEEETGNGKISTVSYYGTSALNEQILKQGHPEERASNIVVRDR